MKRGRIYFWGQIVRAFGGLIGSSRIMQLGMEISDRALMRGYRELET